MMIDDFSGAEPPVSISEIGGWSQALNSKPSAEVVAFDGENVLRVPGSGNEGYANLTKAAQVPWRAKAILAFRVWIPEEYAGDLGLGLSNISAGAAGTELGQRMAGYLRFTAAGSVQVHDGGFQVADQILPSGQWVAFRIHMDTATDRWTADVALNETITPLTWNDGEVSDFAFRGATGESDLTHFALRANAGHGDDSGLFLDDLTLEVRDIPPPEPNPTLGGYKGIWFTLGQFSEYGDKYSGGLGTYTANHNPLAVYAHEVNKTFFVYGGTTAADEKHLLLMASWYDHATHTVPRPTIVHDKNGVDDPHDNPSISIDSDGHIWVFVAGRNTTRPGILYKSEEPYSVERFERILVFEDMTYPQPFFDPDTNEFQFLFTKYTSGRELYFATSADGADWSPHTKLAGFGGHYQVASRHPGTGKLGTFFNWHPGGDVNKRTNVYYMESVDDGATWRAADGTVLTLPLNTSQNPALVDDLAAQNLLMYTCDLNWDADGHPLLLYVAPRDYRPGPAGDPREWRISRWTGTEWITQVITTSTHAYDMGSLYVDGNRWTVIAPTGTGPQALGTGGEIEVWTSDDQGLTWVKQRAVTRDSVRNHGYARRPLFAREPFFALWADGDTDRFSESHLYFCNQEGTRVWKLPYSMDGETAQPVEIDPPYVRWVSRYFSSEEIGEATLTLPGVDAEGDGWENLLEHALGTHPREEDAPPITFGLEKEEGSDTYLAATFTRRVDAADVQVAVEVSDHPAGPWHSGAGHTAVLSRERYQTSEGEEMETVRVRDAHAAPSGTTRFIRLTVILVGSFSDDYVNQ
jgi:hypothetical protein